MSHMRLKFAALAVAYKAKCNEVDPLDVDHLLTEVDTLLLNNHPVFRGVANFATQYLIMRGDSEGVRALGDTLAKLVEAWAMPEPVDLHRVDIHG